MHVTDEDDEEEGTHDKVGRGKAKQKVVVEEGSCCVATTKIRGKWALEVEGYRR